MGKHGIRLSEVSLGAWLTYGNSVEQDITTKCIHEAFNQGILTIKSLHLIDLFVSRDHRRKILAVQQYYQ